MTEPDNDESTLPVARRRTTPQRIGRYELLGRLGKGGMGIVYRARDTQLDREVAVKMLLTDVADVEETRERFIREARASAELTHRNIIKIYDFGEENGRAFIVMELLVGQSLAERLKGGEPVPHGEALEIMKGVTSGLAFAHEKSIVHRDLKPGNLFLPEDGPVKVLDFGLARIASSNLTRSGLVFGTPDYMSPEQVRGKVADHRSDIFSLGAVFYHLVSGRKPFAAGSLPMVMRKVVDEDVSPLPEATPALARIIGKALQKDPDARYQRMDALLDDLQSVGAPEDAGEHAPAADDATVLLQRLGRYEMVERIGRGGMGVVYRARDPVLDRDVAIKSILGDLTADEPTAAQFEREARAAARLQHPNIITIYELGESEGSPYIVMEFLGGTDLEGLMRDRPRFPLLKKLDLLTQLCRGLGFAHAQGVVHRDIKPSNVRVLDDGTVKLLDFGIAKLSRSDPTFSDLAGSVAFMAPEQLEGSGVDARSDIFAVGALMYELLGGRPPFAGDSPAATAYQVLNDEPAPLRALASEVPEALEATVARALEKHPDRRFQTVGELAEALRRIGDALARSARGELPDLDLRQRATRVADEEPADVSLHRAGEPEVVRRAPRRALRRVLGVAAVLLLVGLAGAGGVLGTRLLDADLPAVPGVELPRSPGLDAILALAISSEPAGASVLVDGAAYLGVEDEPIELTTPTAIPLRGAFPGTLELQRAGYQPAEVSVPDGDGPTRSVQVTLGARAVGRVTVSGPYPFEVWLGNRRVSEAATDHEVRLAVGSSSIRLRNAELFLEQRVPVRVAENERLSIEAPPLGLLTVFSRPGNCEILIDEQNIGFPPIQGRQVAAGPHTVA